MLFILFGMIAFFFMAIGAVVFLICVLIPPARKYAFSAALWCTTWGPCSIALMTLAGVAFVTQVFLTKNGDITWMHASTLAKAFGWGYVIFGISLTVMTATGLAWLHQMILNRTTFAFFRLYAAVVSAGIGGVYGVCVGWWMAYREVTHLLALWAVGATILILGFGTAAYKGAHALRGKAPTNLTWISPEEFSG